MFSYNTSSELYTRRLPIDYYGSALVSAAWLPSTASAIDVTSNGLHLTRCIPNDQLGRPIYGIPSLQSSVSHGLYGTLPDHIKLQSLTLMAWIIPSTLNTFGVILQVCPSGAGNDGRGYFMMYNGANGTVYFELGPGTGAFSVLSAVLPVPPLTSRPVLITGTYDGASFKLYCNGVLFATKSEALAINYTNKPTYGPTPAATYIGVYHNSNDTLPTNDTDLSTYSTLSMTGHTIFSRALTGKNIRDYYLWTTQQSDPRKFFYSAAASPAFKAAWARHSNRYIQ
jgi:hypothetical protein